MMNKRIFATTILFLPTVAWSLQQDPQKSDPPPAPEKIGAEMCLVCHDTFTSLKRTPHASVECEACHGAGSLHVESGDLSLSFKNKSFGWVKDQCQACHRQAPHLSSFARSSHARGMVSCATCHQAHPEQALAGLLAKAEKDLCASCHQDSAAQFRKPYHHPVLEGAMDCSDCHTPHSEDLRRQRGLAVGTESQCVSCHADKKGPFVFEHASLESGCQSCHQPHGSVNPKMLVRSQVRQLCLECHSMSAGTAGSQPFSFHDLRSPRFRECTVCHRAIHGSNVSPAFLR
ncbi:MAG: DmsE family decaheme c-type cytochrome [Acidobacteriota bacterium]